MQSSDGMLHLAYAYHNRQGIKYVTLSEESVAGKKREKVGLFNSGGLVPPFFSQNSEQ